MSTKFRYYKMALMLGFLDLTIPSDSENEKNILIKTRVLLIWKKLQKSLKVLGMKSLKHIRTTEKNTLLNPKMAD